MAEVGLRVKSDMSNKKVLITGGAGFIGGFLARALSDQGHTVHILDSFSRGRKDKFLDELLARENISLHEIDLLQSNALADLESDYSHIFHLAARLGVQGVINNPYQTLRDNMLLLEPVIAFALEQVALERFVFTSTSEIYAGSLEHMDMPLPTPETTPLALPDLDRPRMSYMLSKIYGEAMVRHSGLPFTIIRPHNVYGPRMGQEHVVPQLLQKVHDATDGGVFEVYSVEHMRTFCFIDDAIEMLTRAALSPDCKDQCLNLGTQDPEITIGHLAEIIIETVGRNLTIKPLPPTPGSPERRCPDMSLMSKLTGYSSKITVGDGVARTYSWYKEAIFNEKASK